jgi:hypothetical protein
MGEPIDPTTSQVVAGEGFSIEKLQACSAETDDHQAWRLIRGFANAISR